MVIGFDAADVGRFLGHENGHQLTQTCLELSSSLWEEHQHIFLTVEHYYMYSSVFCVEQIYMYVYKDL